MLKEDFKAQEESKSTVTEVSSVSEQEVPAANNAPVNKEKLAPAPYSPIKSSKSTVGKSNPRATPLNALINATKVKKGTL